MKEIPEIEEKFFLLLQIAVGKKIDKITITEDEWPIIYKIATEQSLLGVFIHSIDILSKEGQKPPVDLLYQWIWESEAIKQQNHITNQHCEQLVRWFKNAGYSSCVLKGQGVAKLYPHPESRQAGDIDIWVDAKRDVIVKKMRSDYIGVTYVDYVNCHAAFFTDTDVEVHFRPTYMFNPFVNCEVQKWICENKKAQMTNYNQEAGFGYPTIGFNLVFSLIHIYRHIFLEGIGLRQIMDYYYIITQSTPQERKEAFVTLKCFGLSKFVGAVMFVLKRVFCIEKELMLCEADSIEGGFLLNEILRGGNFGQYDDRNKHLPTESRMKRGIENVKRNLRFMKHYPGEVVWAPVWKVWHWCWRKWKGYL